MGPGLLAPEISLLSFYPPHVDVGPAHSASPHLYISYLDEYGFFKLLDFHATRFLTVLSDGCSIVPL